MDKDTLNERREQHRMQIRKKDLKDQLFQRRLRILQACTQPHQQPTQQPTTTNNQSLLLLHLQHLLPQFLTTPTLSTLTQLRHLSLKHPTLPLISTNPQVLFQVCQFLTSDYDESEEQQQASWILANVSMCNNSWELLAKLNVQVLLLRRVAVLGGMETKENCLWCFNNILTEQEDLKFWLVQNRMLQYLDTMLKQTPTASQLQTIITCVIRLAVPPLSYPQFRRFHRPLLQMINTSDCHLFSLACHCLSKFLMLDMHEMLIVDLEKSKVLHRLIVVIDKIAVIDKVTEVRAQHNFAHIVGCYVQNTQNVAELLRDDVYGVMNNILARTPAEQVKQEILWALSSLFTTASTNPPTLSQASRKLLHHKLLRQILQLYESTARQGVKRCAMKVMALCVIGAEGFEGDQMVLVEMGVLVKRFYQSYEGKEMEGVLEEAIGVMKRMRAVGGGGDG